ncbi:MAG: hypothetical protein ACK5JO_15730 [Halodesulfovibrio sp.]
MAEEQVQESTLDTLLKGFRPAGFFSSAGKTTTHQSKAAVNQRQILWSVRTLDNGAVEISPLVAGFPAPANMRMHKKIERPKFLEQYWPEPELFFQEAMTQFAARGDLKGYPQNLKEVVKAYLPLVLVYLATAQRAKAETVIDFLVARSVPMCEKQKKLLNRVAVELRREGKCEAALDCYASVEKYYGEDEHLHFNIARTLWDMRKLKDCLHHLERCLQINPHLTVARQFRDKLVKMLTQKKAAAQTPKKGLVVDSSFKVSL